VYLSVISEKNGILKRNLNTHACHKALPAETHERGDFQ
jgi:hypothetical protein